MKHILKYIRPYYGYISVTLIIKFIASIMELLIPSILAKIIDEIVPSGDRNGIFIWGGVMTLCAVVAILGNIIANRMSAVSSGKITLHIRHDLFEKISYLSANQLDGFTVPSAISRLTSDTYNLNQLFARMQRIGVRGPILLIGGLAITLVMDAGLTLVLVATLPLIALLVYFVTKKTVPLYTKQQDILDEMVRVVQENITGARVIKALSKTEYEKRRYGEVNNRLSDMEQYLGGIMALTNPGSSLILNIGLTLVVAVGAFRMDWGLTSPGVIIAFINYFTIIRNAMLGITRICVMYSKGEASALRVAEVLTAPRDLEPISCEPAESETNAERKVHIEFRNVSFSYEKVKPNLEDISFSLGHGQTLGILGSTGSGKSTLINLLLRFYDVDDGQILIDGRDIRSYRDDELRTKFGVVFQNDFLFADTVGENISFFRDIPEGELERAAADAQAKEFIDSVGGMSYGVSVRGNNLSGGQKQRLLIARALAKNPEILILDDASSALDYRTDAVLRKALAERYSSTTSIIVAQRISSIKGADLIIVLEGGRMIGRGTHDELMENCPVYRDIAETQMGTGGEAEADE